MHITRRKFLQSSLFIGFALATKKSWANNLPTLAIERRDLFPQGVASGDPTADSAVVDRLLCRERAWHGAHANREQEDRAHKPHGSSPVSSQSGYARKSTNRRGSG